ncbi:DLH domain-containing protein [Mycena kentingensis (nom. inval.)]|nr:DLH domain-containing protein [Mycena kentingensis (nom. inval.)]
MSCPQCFSGAVLDEQPTGSMSTEFPGAYLAPAPADTDLSTHNKRAILLLTDIFGLDLVNSKILADNFAKQLKCDVWVPDLFDGKPPVTVHQMRLLPEVPGEKMSFWTILQLIWANLPSLFQLIRKTPPYGAQRATALAHKLKAANKYEKLGVVGYCFGGGVAILMNAKEPDLLSSVVVAHPSPPSDADLKAGKAPISWACASDDMAISSARLEQIEALYEARRGKDDFVDYEVKVYPKTCHGFAARPRLEHEEIKDAFEKAFQQAVDWFNKTLPV